MTDKEFYNKLCSEYQAVLLMSEDEVYDKYEESKADCIAAYEQEIDFWYSHIYGRNEDAEDDGTCGLDPAFSSWYEVNSMFV